MLSEAQVLFNDHWWIVPTNDVIDGLRLFVGLLSLALALSMTIRLMGQWTTIRLSCIVVFTLDGVDELLLIGQPFAIYRLPGRALVIALMWWGITRNTPSEASVPFMWKPSRKKTSRRLVEEARAANPR